MRKAAVASRPLCYGGLNQVMLPAGFVSYITQLGEARGNAPLKRVTEETLRNQATQDQVMSWASLYSTGRHPELERQLLSWSKTVLGSVRSMKKKPPR